MTAAMTSATTATLPSSSSLLPSVPENLPLVRVAFDYEYDYKTRKIAVKQGEKLYLLQRTNQHWWKCMRPGVNKAFFVPAQYVIILDEHEAKDDTDIRSGGGRSKKPEIQKSTSSVDSANSEIVTNKSRKSIFSTFERLKESKSKPAVPSKSKSSISSRNEGSRASHRVVTKEKSHSNHHHHHERKSGSGSSLRLKNWSASLEELSKQIVFPGLTSESVVDLTSLSASNSFRPISQKQAGNNDDEPSSPTNQPNNESNSSCGKRGSCRGSGSSGGSCDAKFHAFNKCLSFRNPNFPDNNNEEKGSPTNEQKSSLSSVKERSQSLSSHSHVDASSTLSKADSQMKSKDSSDGSLDSGGIRDGVNIPVPKGPPIRLLADNWAEYFSPEKGRYFYYNADERKASWKPPRSSSNRRSDECLASGRSGASTIGSSIENSLDNLYEEINNAVDANSINSSNAMVGLAKPDILQNQIPSSVGSSRKSVAAISTDDINAVGRSQNNSGTHGSSSSVFDSQENLDSSHAYFQQEDDAPSEFSFANLSSSIPIPEGWEECYDESIQQLYYVHKVTGAKRNTRSFELGLKGMSNASANVEEDDISSDSAKLLEEILKETGFDSYASESSLLRLKCELDEQNNTWFTSTDPQGKIYFYEENSSQSSWFLPEIQVASPSNAQDSSAKHQKDSGAKAEGINSTGNSTSNSDELLSFGTVKKRHSAGDAIDRGTKSKSLFLPDYRAGEKLFPYSNSLPRQPNSSIWHSGHTNRTKRDGMLGRTKITEGGKKVRKNWGVVYAVLTESHLSLFKDQKSFTAHKSELEIELNGSTVEWTEEKSSRKNVFQLNTRSDLQMLFQHEDKSIAEEWFKDIKRISESNPPLDISMRFSTTECPETLSDPPIGERKFSSRLHRNKSTKIKITPSGDDMGADRKKITANLKKFFSRRPPRESLVKKGIYKDEPVFGCSLEKLCSLEKGSVPRFVQECILAIEQKDENLKTDGIYRASGNLSQVQKIRLQVDQNNFQCLYQEEDVHVLAGSLKLFFREMREPLISYDLFEKSFEAINSNKKDKVSKFRDIVKNLAKPNRDTLQALLRHLLKVAEYAEYNRMMIPNLAIVFGPTLMWPAIESKNMALDLMQQNYVIEALLVDFESIFQ